ncbi:hypothetical protein Tco_1147002 [Tanacetum coccineum]
MEQFKIDQLEANLERFKIDQAAINSDASKQWAFLQATIEKNKVEADRQFAGIMNALKALQPPTTLLATIPRFEENSGETRLEVTRPYVNSPSSSIPVRAKGRCHDEGLFGSFAVLPGRNNSARNRVVRSSHVEMDPVRRSSKPICYA